MWIGLIGGVVLGAAMGGVGGAIALGFIGWLGGVIIGSLQKASANAKTPMSVAADLTGIPAAAEATIEERVARLEESLAAHTRLAKWIRHLVADAAPRVVQVARRNRALPSQRASPGTILQPRSGREGAAARGGQWRPARWKPGSGPD